MAKPISLPILVERTHKLDWTPTRSEGPGVKGPSQHEVSDLLSSAHKKTLNEPTRYL
jgi:hypothetical protein